MGRYIKLNRPRLQRKEDDASVDDCMTALCALYEVLLLLCKLMAPLTPFLAEHLYRRLAVALPRAEREDSVHFCRVPDVLESARDPQIERAVAALQPVVELGRTARDRKKLGLKVPLPDILVVHRDQQYLDDVLSLERYVQKELNVRSVRALRFADAAQHVRLKAMPNHTVLGARFGKAYGGWQAKIRALEHEPLARLLEEKKLVIDGEVRRAAPRCPPRRPPRRRAAARRPRRRPPPARARAARLAWPCACARASRPG